MRFILFSPFILLCPGLYAQPATEVYLLEISTSPEMVMIKSLTNISRNPGYDNQPHFTPDGKAVLFSSVRGGGQSDIYRYEIKRKRTEKVTCTPESEYSPVTRPDGVGISMVRVEKDSSQHLCYYAESCSRAVRLLPRRDSIGYYAWLREDLLALFILGEPNYLLISDTLGNNRVEYSNPGRSLHRIPGTSKVSFVWKRNDSDWWLCSLDENGIVKKLTNLEAPYEDYCWLPDGRIAWARDSEVRIALPGELSPTPFSFNLSAFGISGITRVTVNHDATMMCIVAAELPQSPGEK